MWVLVGIMFTHLAVLMTVCERMCICAVYMCMRVQTYIFIYVHVCECVHVHGYIVPLYVHARVLYDCMCMDMRAC